MFEMKFELDEKRMIRDGIDPNEKWSELNSIFEEVGQLEIVRPGLILTQSSGIRSWLTDILEDTPWFMKYVCTWEFADPQRREDAISIFNQMGIRCCYD